MALSSPCSAKGRPPTASFETQSGARSIFPNHGQPTGGDGSGGSCLPPHCCSQLDKIAMALSRLCSVESRPSATLFVDDIELATSCRKSANSLVATVAAVVRITSAARSSKAAAIALSRSRSAELYPPVALRLSKKWRVHLVVDQKPAY